MTKMIRSLGPLAGVALVLGAAGAWAQDWPRFRGPNGTGVADAQELPTEWGATKSVAWKVKIPGYSWSSPIVSGGRVFVTTAVTDGQQAPATEKGSFPKGKGLGKFGAKPPDVVYRWEVHCLDAATGKTLWKRVAREQKPRTIINPSNTYASETPVTDGERVYAYFGMTGVFCYDFNGKRLWEKDLGFYPTFFGHGTGASPALDGEQLFVQCDNDKQSFLVALDKRTGDERWRVARPERTTWTTPFVWKTPAGTAVVCCGNRLRAYDPASGAVKWEMGGFEGQHMASPTADADCLYVGVGGAMSRRKPLAAIRAGAAGDITLKAGESAGKDVAWFITNAGSPMPTPLAYRGHLYLLDQTHSILTCHDAKTGKQVYRQRLPRGEGFVASPWAGDGKVYCLDEKGCTYVIQAGPEFRLLAENNLDEQCGATPAVAGGAIFLRGVDHLYCIKNPG